MKTITNRLSVVIISAWIILMGVAQLALPLPSMAATFDEIIAMHDAGVPSEIIIDVIEATGIEEEIDTETLVLLLDYGVDNTVIDYIIDLIGDEDIEVEVSGYQNLSAGHPNRAGGEGFYHGGDTYNPLNDYSSVRYREDYYYDNTPQRGTSSHLPGGVIVYEPPVYVQRNGSRYNNWYNAPRYYPGSHGSWNNGSYYNGYHGYDGCNSRHNYNDRYWNDGEWDNWNGYNYHNDRSWHDNRDWRDDYYYDDWYGGRSWGCCSSHSRNYRSGFGISFSDSGWGIRIGL